MKYKMVELYAGSQQVSNYAKKKGFETFTVDWEDYHGTIDLLADIEELTLSDLPYIPDFLWMSPDCRTYSVAGLSRHREKGTLKPVSEYAKKCDVTNRHTMKLIDEMLKLNPNMIYFIENPRGAMRKMDWIQDHTRHTVWYCQYGDSRAKPTDIWTNSKLWVPRPECHNYRNGIKHCHHEASPKGLKTGGTQGRNGAYNRSLIPKPLIKEIIKVVKKELKGRR